MTACCLLRHACFSVILIFYTVPWRGTVVKSRIYNGNVNMLTLFRAFLITFASNVCHHMLACWCNSALTKFSWQISIVILTHSPYGLFNHFCGGMRRERCKQMQTEFNGNVQQTMAPPCLEFSRSFPLWLAETLIWHLCLTHRCGASENKPRLRKVWEGLRKDRGTKNWDKRGGLRYLSVTSELLTIQAFISQPRAD